MQGLRLTYQTLGTTRNEAAIDVLISALDDPDTETRQHALGALIKRREASAPARVLANWDKLLPEDLAVLRPKKSWLAESISQALQETGPECMTAIAAAEALELTQVMPQLILQAESSASGTIREAATESVVAMVRTLGQRARDDRDQPTIRGPVLARLADSVRYFSMHRNERLVDAFLLVAAWGDSQLRQMLASGGEQVDLIFGCLAKSDEMGVVDLLAGFVRRRNLPRRIGQIIQTRCDESFRDALLRKISPEPSASVLRNLRDIGLPASCRGGEQILDSVASHLRAPLIHVYVAASPASLQTLHLIAGAVERGTGCEIAAAIGLSRCEVPDTEFWMRAALPVADGDEDVISADANAHLLKRYIDLLDHPDPALVRSVRRVLQPLHAGEMLDRFDTLRPRSRQRLGRVVMMIDPDAIDRVRDALRHPVLANRLQAIATADALAVVDLLSDSFEHIAHQDHQEARIRAAQAMSGARGRKTLHLLHEMTDLPECPVRDAALAAIRFREKSAR